MLGRRALSSLAEQPARMNLLALTPKHLRELAYPGSPSEEAALLKEFTQKSHIAKLETHLFKQGCTDIMNMTNLSLKQRKELMEKCIIEPAKIRRHQVSRDGTQKWLLELDEKSLVEMVHIPDIDTSLEETATPRKGTLCVSSQVGCSLTCSFCRTGTQKLVRNLTGPEIFQQVYLAIQQLNGFQHWKSHQTHLIDNVVMMGQGEPLYNYSNVSQGVLMMMDRFELNPKRITISTSGVAPIIPKVAQDLGCGLALSLHATYDNLRDKLVPLNRTFNIQTVMKAVEHYVSSMPKSRHRRVTFEYVMLNQVNDSLREARDLIKLIQHLPCHVNLMPFNPWKGSLFESSSESTVKDFADVLRQGGIPTTVRQPRGRDINAACGQLKSKEEDKKKSNV